MYGEVYFSQTFTNSRTKDQSDIQEEERLRRHTMANTVEMVDLGNVLIWADWSATIKNISEQLETSKSDQIQNYAWWPHLF